MTRKAAWAVHSFSDDRLIGIEWLFSQACSPGLHADGSSKGH